jgi:hypothetical protein
MNLVWFFLIVALWLLAMALLRQRARTGGHNAGNTLWRDVLAGGVLWLLLLGFFWRTLSGAAYQPADGGDLLSFLFPTYRFAASELAQGRLPLWNPTLYGGAPFIGDIQAGFLYLPNLVLFLTNPDFPYSTMQGLVVGHLFWAGLGMYVLLRTLRWPGQPVSRPAALFAALAFALADPLLIHVGNLNLVAVLSWMPWVLAAFVRGLQSGQWRWAGIAGLLFALGSYAGHAQSSLYIGLALALLTVGWIATAAVDQRTTRPAPEQSSAGLLSLWFSSLWFPSLWRPAAMLVVTGVLAALLAAPILLPALELTRYAVRSDFTYQDTVAYSLAPTQMLAGLVTPSLFGRGPALHWGLWERVELPYLGAPVFILALCALVLAQPAVRRRLWMWVGIAGFGLVMALGIYTVVHGWLTLLLPMFDQFRAPARAIVLWALGMSVLAGVGFDAVAVAMARSRTATIFLAGGALLLAMSVMAGYALLFVTQADPQAFLRASLAALALVIAFVAWLGAWVLIAARQHGRLSFAAFSVLMIALLFVELAAAGAYTDISEQAPTEGFRHEEILTFLRSDPDLFRIDTRTDLEGLWQPDTAALAGLQDVGGIANPLALRSYQAFWESTGGRATRRYDLLNVKYVLVREGTPLPEGKFEKVLGPVRGVDLYVNHDFAPRAWFAPASADLNDLELPAEVMSAVVSAYSPTAMEFAVDAPENGWLVISEFWYPGWRATVNGAEGEIVQVNGALRAVAVGAGESTVTLRYWPSVWTWGLLAAAVGLVLLVLLSWRPRSRRAPTGSA